MPYMKALSLLVQKLWPRLSFFPSRSKVKVKVTRSLYLVPTERSCHKGYTCPISLASKVIAKVKFFFQK